MLIWMFPKIRVPPFHTTKWSFSVGKPMGLLGKPTILGNPHIVKISDSSSCGFLLLNLEVAPLPTPMAHVIKNFREDVSTNDTTIHGKSLLNFTKNGPPSEKTMHVSFMTNWKQSKIEDKEVSIFKQIFYLSVLSFLVLSFISLPQYNP